MSPTVLQCSGCKFLLPRVKANAYPSAQKVVNILVEVLVNIFLHWVATFYVKMYNKILHNPTFLFRMNPVFWELESHTTFVTLTFNNNKKIENHKYKNMYKENIYNEIINFRKLKFLKGWKMSQNLENIIILLTPYHTCIIIISCIFLLHALWLQFYNTICIERLEKQFSSPSDWFTF